MLSFILVGFQSVLFSLKKIVQDCMSASFLMRSWQFLAFWDTLMLTQNNKGFQFVRRKNEIFLIGRLDISVIFTKTELRVLRIRKSMTWSQRYRILTALCFDARLLWHWRSTICRDKIKPFERTFISLLLSFYNSALMRRKKKKKKKASYMKFTLIPKSSVKLPGIPFQTNENPHEQDARIR